MFSNIFGKKKKKKDDQDANVGKIVFLVIESYKPDDKDCDDYYKLFSSPNNRLKDGRIIEVHQAGWENITLTAYSDTRKPVVTIRSRNIQPDFIMIRELCRRIRPGCGYENILHAFMVAQTPAINSLHSIFCLNERALMNAEMIRLNRKYGQDKFPIITQYFYPTPEQMVITPDPYPIVLKIGTFDAGYNKIKIESHEQFLSMKSIVAMQGRYVTAEKYIEGVHDLRLQKIGNNYRAFKRVALRKHKQWKGTLFIVVYIVRMDWILISFCIVTVGNTQSAYLEEIKLEERYKFWMEECSKAFGQRLDICTVDILVDVEDKEYIVEFNGCASGFCAKEDVITLRDYVIQYFNNYFVDKNEEEFNSNNRYPTNDDLIRDIKDIDKYDVNKYMVEPEEKDNDDETDDATDDVEEYMDKSVTRDGKNDNDNTGNNDKENDGDNEEQKPDSDDVDKSCMDNSNLKSVE